MIRLKGTERTFISKDVIGFADRLAEEGTVTIRLDLLMLGFSYAVQNNLMPAEDIKRHELTDTQSLGEKSIAYESAACWYAQELGELDSIKTSNDLTNFICRLGIAGVRALQERWEVKSKSQIQWDIMQLAGEKKNE
jgi:hypothetical protein